MSSLLSLSLGSINSKMIASRPWTCYTLFLSWPGVLKGVKIVMFGQHFSFWPLEGLEMMIRCDTVASNELSFSCTSCHLGLQ